MRNPKETYAKYTDIALGKTQTKASKIFLLAVMAGIFIAFAGVGAGFANSLVNKVCGSFVFCGGLSMVLVAGSELFTGNCLLIMPVLDKKIKLSDMVKNLIVVYAGNLAGSLLVAFLASYSGTLNSVAETVVSCAESKVSLSFTEALIRGFLCNILVCVAVWMSFTSDRTSDKIIIIIFPVALFVLSGFEHSVANMYFIPAGMFVNRFLNITGRNISIFDFVFKNLLPVTLGNILGGISVGAVYRFVYGKKVKTK